MKKLTRRLLALTLAMMMVCSLVLTLFSGCQADPISTEPSVPSADGTGSAGTGTDTEHTEEMQSTDFSAPELQYGTLETQRLAVTSVGGRTGNLSPHFKSFTEKESGYYYQNSLFLYYADKSDPSYWVPVCGKPDCAHNDQNCDAHTFGGSLVTEDRIYYLAREQTAAATAPGVVCEFVVSMALDGTDRKVEFYFEDFNQRWKTYGTSGSFLLTPECYFVYHSNLNNDGQYDIVVYVADKDGEYIAYSGVSDVQNASNFCGNTIMGIYGDFCYYMADIEGLETSVYRLRDRQLYSTDLGNLPVEGSHLDGNILRFYRPGDGYYDIDLTTRQETRLDDAQLENAYAHIMLPNCIFETTLIEFREPGFEGEHQLRFYDGVQWYNVALPEELLYGGDEMYLKPVNIISDRVIFECYVYSDNNSDTPPGCRLYQMLLEQEEPVLELMAVLTSN